MEQIAARSHDGLGGSPSGSYVHEEGAHRTPPPYPTAPKDKSHAALLWGIGSTVLSALGFLGWGLFEQYNSSLTELRTDLKHFNEVSSSFVKRDTLNRFREQYKTQFGELQTMSASNKQLEVELKASEKTRMEMHRELIRMRERLAYVEGRQSVTTVRGNGPVEKPVESPPAQSLPMNFEE